MLDPLGQAGAAQPEALTGLGLSTSPTRTRGERRAGDQGGRGGERQADGQGSVGGAGKVHKKLKKQIWPLTTSNLNFELFCDICLLDVQILQSGFITLLSLHVSTNPSDASDYAKFPNSL